MSRTFRLFGLFIAACACTLFLIDVGCSRRSSTTVTLAGSTAFQPFAEKLAEQFMAKGQEFRINVQGGGSAVGIQSALSGAADIGMADMPELPKEAAALSATIVARDGIAIVVHPENPVTNLSAEQTRDIFSGKITNWSAVGGKDAQIHVISREEGSGTRRSFDSLALAGEKLAPGALYQDSNGTAREAVASDPSAIGYVSVGMISDRVKALSYNGATPTHAHVKAGLYPLSRPIFFLTRGELNERTASFIQFVLSPESQLTLEAEGLVAAK